jgi:hypothetical protein
MFQTKTVLLYGKNVSPPFIWFFYNHFINQKYA